MKRLIFALLVASLFGACEKETFLTVDQNDIIFGEAGGNQALIITANKVWNASSNQGWCKISPKAGDGSEQPMIPISITCDRNTLFDSRSCIITVQCEEKVATITVVQDAAEAFVAFNDQFFEDYCLKKFDLNHDNGLSMTEAAQITIIDLLNANQERMVSLKGIECMPNLEKLLCGYYGTIDSRGRISLLDVSNNLLLKSLDCQYNNLASINVSKNTVLEYLNCRDNAIGSLIVSKNVALRHLVCDNCGLSALDVSKNPEIKWLTCTGNQLTSLNLGNLTNLIQLSCGANKLSYLSVSNNVELVDLFCSNNQISKLDVSNNSKLKSLLCTKNQITELIIGDKPQLKTLKCNQNKIKSLDIDGCTSLETLDCSDNQLTSLDVSNHLKLERLLCENNPGLTEIWLKKGQVIPYLYYDKSVTTIKYK